MGHPKRVGSYLIAQLFKKARILFVFHHRFHTDSLFRDEVHQSHTLACALGKISLYENMSMQYTAIFHGSKNEKILVKKMIFFLFFL